MWTPVYTNAALAKVLVNMSVTSWVAIFVLIVGGVRHSSLTDSPKLLHDYICTSSTVEDQRQFSLTVLSSGRTALGWSGITFSSSSCSSIGEALHAVSESEAVWTASEQPFFASGYRLWCWVNHKQRFGFINFNFWWKFGAWWCLIFNFDWSLLFFWCALNGCREEFCFAGDSGENYVKFRDKRAVFSKWMLYSSLFLVLNLGFSSGRLSTLFMDNRSSSLASSVADCPHNLRILSRRWRFHFCSTTFLVSLLQNVHIVHLRPSLKWYIVLFMGESRCGRLIHHETVFI